MYFLWILTMTFLSKIWYNNKRMSERGARGMYQVGEKLLYGTEGVCRIDEICEMKIGAAKTKYYVLRPIYREGSTVFVPVDNEALTAKMRPLLTAEEIDALLKEVSGEETVWIEEASERKAQFQQAMLGNERREILRMLRTLYLRRKKLQAAGKHLRSNDDQMLRDAEKLLGDEFALVLGIRPREVPEYIREHLNL